MKGRGFINLILSVKLIVQNCKIKLNQRETNLSLFHYRIGSTINFENFSKIRAVRTTIDSKRSATKRTRANI